MAYLKTTTALAQVNLHAPIGTKMLFNQTAAPVGWTKVTSSNDVALRLTSGTVGTGGTVAFETAFASQTPTATSGAIAGHTVSIGELSPGQVQHKPGTGAVQTIYASGTTFGVCASKFLINTSTGGVQAPSGGSCSIYNSIYSPGSGATHTHAFTQPTISAVNLDVSFVDVIIATKD